LLWTHRLPAERGAGKEAGRIRRSVKTITSKVRAGPQDYWPAQAAPEARRSNRIIPYRRVKGGYCGNGLGSLVNCRRHLSVSRRQSAAGGLAYSRAGGEQ